MLAGYSRVDADVRPIPLPAVQLKLAVDDLGVSVDFYREGLFSPTRSPDAPGTTTSSFVFGEYGTPSPTRRRGRPARDFRIGVVASRAPLPVVIPALERTCSRLGTTRHAMLVARPIEIKPADVGLALDPSRLRKRMIA